MQTASSSEELLVSLELRKLTYGTSRFLVSLGLTCNLPFNTICFALRIYHHAREYLSYRYADRRPLVAAALCLSWKYWEDREGLRDNHKVRTLARAIYTLCCAPLTEDVSESDGLEAVRWASKDSGVELSRIRERIKLQELIILRALRFDLFSDTDGNYFTGMFPTAIRSLQVGSSDLTERQFELMISLALGIASDFYMWPLAIEYTLQDIAYAAVWKAAIGLGLKMNNIHIFKDRPSCSEILALMRLTYNWVEEIGNLRDGRNKRRATEINVDDETAANKIVRLACNDVDGCRKEAKDKEDTEVRSEIK